MFAHTPIEKKEILLSSTYDISKLFSYPIDMQLMLDQKQYKLDDAGVPLHVNPHGYHPTIIAQYALVQWNQYLTIHCQSYLDIFLLQAQWFVEHEFRLIEGASGWPITLPHPDVYGEGTWLSAVTQGQAISVLLRAYHITREKIFLEVAHRAVRTFEQDILDGGVCAPVGDNGVFFEEIAVYPAPHIFSGFLLALLGLYDYSAFTDNVRIRALIQRSITTMHLLLDEFDTGFWTRIDLLHRHLASPSQLSLQITLLEAITAYSGCEHCLMLVSRWRSYQCSLMPRFRYLINRCLSSSGSAILNQLRSRLFPALQASQTLRVCVPITAFPITGGMRTVVRKIAEATVDTWHLEYLTQYIGPETENFTIHQFGNARCYPWEFPYVWFYAFAGFWKLVSLLREGNDYDLILLQDGVFTAAFGALVAKMAGIRSVCIDHGNLSLLNNPIYHTERINALTTTNWPRCLLARVQYKLYWPSLSILARIGAHFVDHYFIPGVAGDGVEEICKTLGVPQSRITRFANMIEVEHHVIPDERSRAETLKRYGIPEDAIIIAIICRLAPAKGLEIALDALSQSLVVLPPELRTRVRIIIAGDGPLRKQLENDIHERGLMQVCILWGEASTEDVITILGVSDIFLFTSWRAAGCPLTVLEAMASGCAVIASTESLANQKMLAEERGVALTVGDTEGVSRAIVKLVRNPELRRQMGALARNYVTAHHSATAFRRSLLRVSYWSGVRGNFEDQGES